MTRRRSLLAAPALAFAAAMPALATLPPAPAGVQVTHEHGIEFVTVGDAGNSAYPNSTIGWTGLGNDRLGRGSVGYDYRIARTEVTSAQWVEFLNVFASRPIPQSMNSILAPNGVSEFYAGPSWFGGFIAESDPVARTARYELRTDVPDAANIPVWGLSWRSAALYCNWLHNEKATDWDALVSGAYDTSTWGTDPETNSFTDDIVRQPGAQFWIPTLDEWGKAAFYDPNRDGEDQGGWWDRHYSMNEVPIPGFPAELGAQSSTGIPVYDYLSAARDIALASYPTMSPWGLFDTAGGTSEIVGEYANPLNATHFDVLTLGSVAGTSTLDPQYMPEVLDISTRAFSGGTASFFMGNSSSGLRIAAAVPSPACIWLIITGIAATQFQRRNKE